MVVAGRSFAASDNRISGEARAKIPTTIMGAVGINMIEIAAMSAAEASGAAVCVLVNNASSSQALTVNSGATILAPSCEMHVRSSGLQAAVINDGHNLNLRRLCVKSSNLLVNGGTPAALEKGCDAVGNPFVGRLPFVSVPSFPANDCSAGGMAFTGNNNAQTVPPGNYCNLNFNGTFKSITLGKGRYSQVNLNSAETVTLGEGSYDGINVSGTITTLNLGKGHYRNLSLNTGTTVNLNPGTFENLTVNSGTKTINLAPGFYIWKGVTQLNGVKLVGEDVTIYYPDKNSYITVNNGATLALKAPRSGIYSGILFYEPDGLAGSSFNVSGNSGQVLEGLIYWPSRSVTFNATSTILSDRMTLVVDKLTLNQTDWRFDAGGKGITAATGGAARLTH